MVDHALYSIKLFGSAFLGDQDGCMLFVHDSHVAIHACIGSISDLVWLDLTTYGHQHNRRYDFDDLLHTLCDISSLLDFHSPFPTKNASKVIVIPNPIRSAPVAGQED